MYDHSFLIQRFLLRTRFFGARMLLVAIILSIGACTWVFGEFAAPKVSLVAIEPVNFGLFEQRFNLRLRFRNTNDVELPIRGMSYTLQLNGSEFAEGVTDQAITIPEYGEAVITVPIVVNLTTLLKHAAGLKEQQINYELAGQLGLGHRTLKVPFNYSGAVDFKL